MQKNLMLLPVVAFLSACSPQMMEAVRTGIVQGVNQGLNNPSNGYGVYNGNPYITSQASRQGLLPQQINPINAAAQDVDCYEPYNTCLENSRDVTPCGNMFNQCIANRPKGGPGEVERFYPNVSMEAIKGCKDVWQACVLGNSLRGWNNNDKECDFRYRQCLKNSQ